MKVIALVGRPASGKTTVSKLMEAEGFIKFTVGDIVRDETQKAGADLSDLTGFSKKFREKNGICCFVEKIISMIKDKEVNYSIIDGLRKKEEDECLRREFGKEYILVKIHAPIEIRHPRARERGRTDGGDIDLREKTEFDNFDIGTLMKRADFIVYNDGSVGKLKKNIEKIINEYQKRKEMIK